MHPIIHQEAYSTPVIRILEFHNVNMACWDDSAKCTGVRNSLLFYSDDSTDRSPANGNKCGFRGAQRGKCFVGGPRRHFLAKLSDMALVARIICVRCSLVGCMVTAVLLIWLSRLQIAAVTMIGRILQPVRRILILIFGAYSCPRGTEVLTAWEPSTRSAFRGRHIRFVASSMQKKVKVD